MKTKIIDGKLLSQKEIEKIRARVERISCFSSSPGLATILISDDSASKIYIRNKHIACRKVGISTFHFDYPQDVSESLICKKIEQLNADDRINGILVQLPFPHHLDVDRIISQISLDKDVDCFHSYNRGLLYSLLKKIDLQRPDVILPCTPNGILHLLSSESIDVSGKRVLIIGRSNIVSKPMAMLMLLYDATVTIAHSKTRHIEELIATADIIISAVGKCKFIDCTHIKKNAVLIDVGINRDQNGQICGDFDFCAEDSEASFITPVPGGVGPMTIAMLLHNTVKLKEKILQL